MKIDEGNSSTVLRLKLWKIPFSPGSVVKMTKISDRMHEKCKCDLIICEIKLFLKMGKKHLGARGTVIRPLLFLILIGDIDRNVANSFLASFADDTRLLRKVS